LIVAILKRNGNVEKIPIYALTYGGTVTVKPTFCDLDDVVVLLGIDPRPYDDPTKVDIRGIFPFAEGAVGNEDVNSYLPYFSVFSKPVKVSVKFSGLFGTGEYAPYNPANVNPKVSMKNYKTDNLSMVIGTIRSSDSTIYMNDAMTI
jgi:hypothetical protein